MSRRSDYHTAEKVSLVLLTRAAFGAEAGLRMASVAGLSISLMAEIFARPSGKVRHDIQGVDIAPERRIIKRGARSCSGGISRMVGSGHSAASVPKKSHV